MKTISILLIISLLTLKTFCQIQNPTFSKDNYLQKSKNQKETGWVLLAGGTAMAVAGAIIIDNSDDWSTFDFGGILFLGGLTADLISIPFFISSGNNARKAASISFNHQKILIPENNNLVIKTHPSITMRFEF